MRKDGFSPFPLTACQPRTQNMIAFHSALPTSLLYIPILLLCIDLVLASRCREVISVSHAQEGTNHATT
jgi:hypothetical protein